jgi:hypothetical protein
MAQTGVIYLETRFGPHLFTGERYTAAGVTEAVLEGLAEGNGSPVRLIFVRSSKRTHTTRSRPG